MWSITLLLIPCVLCYGFLYSITMHWCSSYVIAQRWVSAKPLSGLQPTTSVFCYSLFFVWSCQSIAVFFVVWHHDKNNLTLKILSRAIKIAKVTCSSWASVTKPADEVLAGQKRYAAAEWERAWTRSPRALSGCSGIAVSPLPWSLAVSISCRITLLWTVLGVRFLVKLEALSLFYSILLAITRWVCQCCILVRRLTPCPCRLQALLQSCRLQVFCDLVDNESSTPPCPTNTDALSTTRVRLDAIPKLFPGYVAFRPAVSTNLPSTQHKLSTNSLQMQPFVSLSASAEDELSTQCPSDNQRDRRLMRWMLK
jgi:hypothetical protein